MAWCGPCIVKLRFNHNNYLVEVSRKKEHISHINSMKQYIERTGEACLISVVNEEEDDLAELPTLPLQKTENPDNVMLGLLNNDQPR